MTEPEEQQRVDPDTIPSADELAQLKAQVQEGRLEVTRLRRLLDDGDPGPTVRRSAELVEANEQLVVAALRARIEIEATSRALNEASRAAGLDALTGIPNRVLMLDRFQHAIMGARRHETKMALLFIDLDDFKLVNDSLGHAIGDQVLRRVAHVIGTSVRGDDTVSRHGGDEFLVLLTEVHSAAEAVAVAEKILLALGTPIEVGQHALRLSASVGVSLYPSDGDTPEALFDRADAAMYHAKRAGSGSISLYGSLPEEDRVARTSMLTPQSEDRAPRHLARAELDRRYAILREANEQLVLAAISAQELQAAAERALNRQSEFLALAAHELRNPLGPIRFASARLGMSQHDTKSLDRALQIIDRQVVHISRLVSDLVDVARFNTGRLRMEPRDLNLVVVVDAAVDTCRPAIDGRRQHLIYERPSTEFVVYGDPDRLAQILDNLLDNASKYTPDEGTITLKVEQTGHRVAVTVADTGIGIAPESLASIFDLFTQEPQALTLDDSGMGIGLTVVQELVEAHQGTVEARSAGIGLGSTFVVTLPLADGERSKQALTEDE